MPRGVPNVIAGAKESHSEDHKITQPKDIILPDDGPIEHDNIIVADSTATKKDYLDQLSFNEDPVDIMVSAAGGDDPEMWVHAAVNGKGIEAFINGKWEEIKFAPVGIYFKTKRKYAEVLLRQRHDTIKHRHEQKDGQDPVNRIQRMTTHKTPCSIIDPSPRHTEWMNRIMREQ